MQTAFFYTITLRLTKAQKRRNVLSENSVDSRGGTRAGKDVPPMLLFIYITNRVATVSPILQKMAERGIHGATMVDCEGMLQTLAADSIEPPPFFGSLRKFINPDHEPGKMLLPCFGRSRSALQSPAYTMCAAASTGRTPVSCSPCL